MLLKKFAVTTETYEKFAPCFAQHDMASTLTICFLCLLPYLLFAVLCYPFIWLHFKCFSFITCIVSYKVPAADKNCSSRIGSSSWFQWSLIYLLSARSIVWFIHSSNYSIYDSKSDWHPPAGSTAELCTLSLHSTSHSPFHQLDYVNSTSTTYSPNENTSHFCNSLKFIVLSWDGWTEKSVNPVSFC